MVRFIKGKQFIFTKLHIAVFNREVTRFLINYKLRVLANIFLSKGGNSSFTKLQMAVLSKGDNYDFAKLQMAFLSKRGNSNLLNYKCRVLSK